MILSPGMCIMWRKRGALAYSFAAVVAINNGLVGLGAYRGDEARIWVDVNEIEWREYQ